MNERYLEDDMLIRRSLEGDRASFNALIRKHEARAYQYAFKLTRDPEEAADVVAEAFVRVHNALGNFRGQSAFTTWLYRIVTNCFLDLKKRDKSKSMVSLDSGGIRTADGEMERQVEDPSPTPDEDFAIRERNERLQRAILHLPEYQRAMIVMYHGELLSYEEISAALDLPVGTVKSRLNRARLNLRDFLLKDEELFRK